MHYQGTTNRALLMWLCAGLLLTSSCKKDGTTVSGPNTQTPPPTTPQTVSLTSATTYTGSVVPGKFSFDQSNNYWTVVGLRPPAATDYDLKLFRDSLFATSLDSSEEDVGKVDFIVGDFNHNSPGKYYPQVVLYSGSGSYDIEWEDGADQLSVPGTTAPITWTANNIVKIWDVNLNGGTAYTFTVRVTSGTADIGAALFKSNNTTYFGKRSDYAVLADANGNGGNEGFVFTPPTNDWYGIVVWTNNAATATITIQVAQ